MRKHRSAPSVIVGIDGSRSAVDAALWAVDEAVSRDIPLRLIYAIDPDAATGSDNQAAAHDLATAEIAIRHAFMAVESTDKPVKIEIEILQDRPVRALTEASKWAAMVCVGSVGLKHSSHDRIGSTAKALATSAHCPVAIAYGQPPAARQRWIVAEVNESPLGARTIRCAVEEAQLRRAPLRVLTTWQSRSTDINDHGALAEARLERLLTEWRTGCPDFDVEVVAVHDGLSDYVAENAESIQLLVVSRDRADGITELVGPPGCAALRDNCSTLLYDR